jgi:hypothetical protein
MSLKESRKKVQRTIVHIAGNYPKKVAVPELLRVKQTIDVELAKLHCLPEPEKAPSCS